MKAKFMTTCFAVVSLLSPLASYSADSDTDRSHPGTFVRDSAITTKVKAKLAAEHLPSLAHIRVDTDKDGIVFLSGSVRSQDEADKAVSIASQTEGVQSVKNDLKVKKDA